MKNKKILMIIAAAFVLLAAILILGMGQRSRSPYDVLQRRGYAGTPEQLLAALVGELVMPESGAEIQTAYDRGCLMGYKGSFGEWTKTLTGYRTEETQLPAYEVMVKNGYAEDLASWLDSLVTAPELLGRSSEDENMTEYEIACEVGFQGSFTQWLVSLVRYNEN